MSVKLITPDEVDDMKTHKIPDGVFEAFNELIVEGWDGHESIVMQNEVMARILEKLNQNITPRDILDKGWLDVEHQYRKAGWKVEYDKPAYNETYEAYFVFTKGRKKKKQPCGEGC